MHPLNVYGYHVRYGHSIEKPKKYTIQESVCFGTLFSSGCKSRYYRIIILKGDVDLNKYYSNYCFFNKHEIINHLKQIPKFCEIKFKVDDTYYEGNEAFQLDLFINSSNRLIHKYVLTWIRNLFEWPFYLYLIHAKELKKLPEFKFESIINIFNLIATVHRDSFNVNIHTFGTNLKPLKKSQIVNQVESGIHQVNYVFPKIEMDIRGDLPQCVLPDTFEEITPELFEKNLPIYLQAYQIIKQNENRDNRKW